MGKIEEIPSSRTTLFFSSLLSVEFLSFVEIWLAVEHTATHCNNLQHTLRQKKIASSQGLLLISSLLSVEILSSVDLLSSVEHTTTHCNTHCNQKPLLFVL